MREPMVGSGIPTVRPRDVKERLDRGDPIFLLDVREADEVETASIAGATVIPSGDVLRRSGEIPKDKDVIIFCHSGGRSMMAVYQLMRKGFTRVSNMAGGIDAWSVEVDPSLPRYE
jgi:rhodanese-related sulfurtransferase